MKTIVGWWVFAALWGLGLAPAHGADLDREALTEQLAWEQAAWEVLAGLDMTGCGGGYGVVVNVTADGAVAQVAPQVGSWRRKPTDAAFECAQELIARVPLPAPGQATSLQAWSRHGYLGPTLQPAWTLDNAPGHGPATEVVPDPIRAALRLGHPVWQLVHFAPMTKDGKNSDVRRKRLVYYSFLSRVLRAFLPAVERCTADTPRDAASAYGNWRPRIRVAPSGHIELLEQTLADLGWVDGGHVPVDLTPEQGPTGPAAPCMARVFDGVRLPKPPGALEVELGVDRLPRDDAAERGGDPSGLALAPASMAPGKLPNAYIERTAGSNPRELQGCYLVALGRQPSLEGAINLGYRLDRDGRVADVWPADDGTTTISSAELAACITGVLRRTRFRSPGGELIATHRFNFKLEPVPR